MADEYNKKLLAVVVGRVCQVIGWQAVQSSALDTLVDVLRRYVQKMGNLSKNYSEIGGRTESNLYDLEMVMNDMGVSLGDLKAFVDQVESMPFEEPVPDATQQLIRRVPEHDQHQILSPHPPVTHERAVSDNSMQQEEDWDSEDSDEFLRYLPPMVSRIGTEVLHDDLAGADQGIDESSMARSESDGTVALAGGPPSLPSAPSSPLSRRQQWRLAAEDKPVMPLSVAAQYLQENYLSLQTHSSPSRITGGHLPTTQAERPAPQVQEPSRLTSKTDGKTSASSSRTSQQSRKSSSKPSAKQAGSTDALVKKRVGRPPGKTNKPKPPPTTDAAEKKTVKVAKPKPKEGSGKKRGPYKKRLKPGDQAATALSASPAQTPLDPPPLMPAADLEPPPSLKQATSLVQSAVVEEAPVVQEPLPNVPAARPATPPVPIVPVASATPTKPASKKKSQTPSSSGKSEKKGEKKKKKKDKEREKASTPVAKSAVEVTTGALQVPENQPPPPSLVVSVGSMLKSKKQEEREVGPEPNPFDHAFSQFSRAAAVDVPPLPSGTTLPPDGKKKKKKKHRHNKHSSSKKTESHGSLSKLFAPSDVVPSLSSATAAPTEKSLPKKEPLSVDPVQQLSNSATSPPPVPPPIKVKLLSKSEGTSTSSSKKPHKHGSSSGSGGTKKGIGSTTSADGTASADSKKKRKKKRKHEETSEPAAAEPPAKKKKKKKPSTSTSTPTPLSLTSGSAATSAFGTDPTVGPSAAMAAVVGQPSTLAASQPPTLQDVSVTGAEGSSTAAVASIAFSPAGSPSSGAGWPLPGQLALPTGRSPPDDNMLDAKAMTTADNVPIPMDVGQAGSSVSSALPPAIAAGTGAGAGGEKIYLCPKCQKPDDGGLMITCDRCNNDEWYHGACVGIQTAPTDNEKWFCPSCEKKLAKKVKKKKKEHSHRTGDGSGSGGGSSHSHAKSQSPAQLARPEARLS